MFILCDTSERRHAHMPNVGRVEVSSYGTYNSQCVMKRELKSQAIAIAIAIWLRRIYFIAGQDTAIAAGAAVGVAAGGRSSNPAVA